MDARPDEGEDDLDVPASNLVRRRGPNRLLAEMMPGGHSASSSASASCGRTVPRRPRAPGWPKPRARSIRTNAPNWERQTMKKHLLWIACRPRVVGGPTGASTL